MPSTAPVRMDGDDFLTWCLDQEEDYELVDGVPVAMPGARQRHDQIVVNVIAELGNQLRGATCRPFSGNTAVRIPNGNIRRPDAGVDCGTFDDQAMAADQPVLVVEVLSPSTRAFDMLGKLEEYKTVPSLRHVLLVDPDEAQVLHWTRADDGVWTHHPHEGLDAAIGLAPPGVTLRLADLYEGLTFRPMPRLVLET